MEIVVKMNPKIAFGLTHGPDVIEFVDDNKSFQNFIKKFNDSGVTASNGEIKKSGLLVGRYNELESMMDDDDGPGSGYDPEDDDEY